MSERDHRPVLNCLRGLAALAVLTYHFRFYADFPVLERLPWLAFGPLGVDFFFVLSGLIISHVYFADFASGRSSYREFLFLRLSRLFPVHGLLMVLMLAGALLAGRELTGAVVVLSVAVLGAQLAVVLGLALTIAGAYLSRGPLGRLMSHRAPFYLGEISFSLYLVHLPLFRVGKAAADALGVWRGPAFCVALLAAAVLAAALLYETVEIPARRAMRGWWSRRQAVRSPRLAA